MAEVDPKAKIPSLFIKVQLQVYVLGKKTAWSSSIMPANSLLKHESDITSHHITALLKSWANQPCTKYCNSHS